MELAHRFPPTYPRSFLEFIVDSGEQLGWFAYDTATADRRVTVATKNLAYQFNQPPPADQYWFIYSPIDTDSNRRNTVATWNEVVKDADDTGESKWWTYDATGDRRNIDPAQASFIVLYADFDEVRDGVGFAFWNDYTDGNAEDRRVTDPELNEAPIDVGTLPDNVMWPYDGANDRLISDPVQNGALFAEYVSVIESAAQFWDYSSSDTASNRRVQLSDQNSVVKYAANDPPESAWNSSYNASSDRRNINPVQNSVVYAS